VLHSVDAALRAESPFQLSPQLSLRPVYQLVTSVGQHADMQVVSHGVALDIVDDSVRYSEASSSACGNRDGIGGWSKSHSPQRGCTVVE
jgi:hypothetical protein